MKITLSEAFTYLVGEKHFYATIANALRRVSAPCFGTMGVGVQKGRVVLVYDPAFIERLSLPAFIWFLEHEMIHLVMDHIPRYHTLLSELHDPEERGRAMRVYQIAADCAANELIRSNPHFHIAQKEMRAIILDLKRATNPEAVLRENDGLILSELFGLPRGRSFEFYQLELMKARAAEIDVLDLGSIAEAVGTNHEHWLESSDAERSGAPLTSGELKGLAEQIRAQVKHLLRKVIDDFNKEQGLVPAEIREWLGHYLAEPIIPWWEILTTRIQASKHAKVKRGVERPNRSLLAMAEEDPEIIATIGVTRDVSFRIIFVEDTSGSMDAASLRIGLSELEHLMRVDDGVEVRFLQGDAAVTFDQVFRSGDTLPREAHGRGGTDFDAYFAYMAKFLDNDETSPDIVIVFTDGYAPVVSPELRLPPEVPVIWLLTEEHHGRHLQATGYGEVIVCDRDPDRMWQYRR
jgi:predicted metal-dependent peptidase